MLIPKFKALRPCAAALFITLLHPQIATAQAAGQTSVTLDQARAIGAQALATGNTQLALQVAVGLLQADPKDEVAHYMMAAAFAQANKPDDSRRAAAKAYRYTDTSVRKFEAAQLAAKMSFQGDRPTLAQIWLRRAANHAPNAQAEAIVASDYKRLRQINPWSFRLNGGFTPTDNLNNGTDNDYLIVNDNQQANFVIPNSSQPLSGTEAHVNATVSYRLRTNETSATYWNTRLYLKEVRLSGEAKALSPTTQNNDFAYAYVSTGLRHAFAIGNNGTTAAVSGSLGQTWAASNPYTRFAQAKVEIGLKLNDTTSLRFDTSIDQQNRIENSSRDKTTLGFGVNLTHKLANGDSAGLGFYLRDTNSDGFNAENEFAALRASYAFGKPIGPLSLSAGLTLSHRNYDSFLIAGGSSRQDTSLSADMTIVMNDISYAGFVPSVTVRANSTSSNISLYETKGISISMGIQSKF